MGTVSAIVAVVGSLIIGFYTQVVIPIKSIEAKIANVEATLMQHDSSEMEIKSKVSDLEKTAVSNMNRIKAIETILKLK